EATAAAAEHSEMRANAAQIPGLFKVMIALRELLACCRQRRTDGRHAVFACDPADWMREVFRQAGGWNEPLIIDVVVFVDTHAGGDPVESERMAGAPGDVVIRA